MKKIKCEEIENNNTTSKTPKIHDKPKEFKNESELSNKEIENILDKGPYLINLNSEIENPIENFQIKDFKENEIINKKEIYNNNNDSNKFLKEDIMKIFTNNNIDIKYKDIIDKGKITIDTFYEKKKGKTIQGKFISRKRGRKRKNDKSEKTHNKNCHDNIIKKIKVKLFNSLIKWTNEILKKLGKKLGETFDLKFLDYNIVSKINAKSEINNLKNPIIYLLSFDINKKNKHLPKDYNKKIIEKLEKKINKDLNNLLNLKFKEWINFFTMKKKSDNTLIQFDKDDMNLFLKEVFEENEKDENYFCNFVYYLYNYENYFKNKKPRENKK